MNQFQTRPRRGDRRFLATWLIEINGDENGVDPDKCKYGEQVCPDLETALKTANRNDLNREGSVVEEVYDVIWTREAWYDCYGERS